MDLPNRTSNRLSNYDYNQPGTYFITICTSERKNILSKLPNDLPNPEDIRKFTPKLLPYGQIAEKYILQMGIHYNHLSIDKYVIMPDHVHILLTIHSAIANSKDRNSVISRFVGTFKRFCNKEIGKNIWQARYYDHVIRNQQDYNEKWEYIDNNPGQWIVQKRGYE